MSSVPLLASLDCIDHVHLVLGDGVVAARRVARSLESGAKVVLITSTDQEELNSGLVNAMTSNTIQHIQREFQLSDITTLGREEVGHIVDMVFITLPPHLPQVLEIVSHCKRLRIPINTTDSPVLSTFSLLSTYRSGPLQIGVSTSGKGCKIASRIRRELTTHLPTNLGDTVTRLGALREKLWIQDGVKGYIEEDDDNDHGRELNSLVVDNDDHHNLKARRVRWLTQICEYYSLSHLCSLTDSDFDRLLSQYQSDEGYSSSSTSSSSATIAIPNVPRKKGKVILVGAGPGSPDHLTQGALRAINTAEVVLADKLISSEVLALIPHHAEIFIARKFPGNADGAQEELQSKALNSVLEGKIVVRLKQGDPFVFGRGGEEYGFFANKGIDCELVPGLTSALTAPLLAAIPVTQRGVADQVLICTGTGRKGALPTVSHYQPKRTSIYLMSLHRIDLITQALLNADYPQEIPVAVVERASCPDQRIIRTRLRYVVDAVDSVGTRPPGLLIVGWSCEVLKRSGEMKKWIVEEGL